jgi:hypothetical protein
MPHYIKTGYWALEKNGYKGWLNLEDIIGGGGSSSAVSVTKAEVDALITANSLVPGQTYIISGVDVPLYGGTIILIQAATTNELALAGHGIFYNPKYQLYGANMWDNYVGGNPTFSNITVYTFYFEEPVTTNNGATGIYYAHGLIEWTSGDWSLATSITGDYGATADITACTSPSYNIGDNVIWGGKHWVNTSGNVGTAIDDYTLSAADWTVIPFNDVDYNVQVDVIHYDYENDLIIRRKDRFNNDVDFSKQYLAYGEGNPIKDFQWGNYPEFPFNLYNGVYGNYIKESILSCLNLRTFSIIENVLTSESKFAYNKTSSLVKINRNILSQSSQIVYNGINQSLYSITNLSENILTQRSLIQYNSFNGGNNSKNIMSNVSFISDNNVSGGIFNNILNNAVIENNVLTFYSYPLGASIYENIMNKGSIDTNYMEGGEISGNTFELSADDSGSIDYNTLINSRIKTNYLDDNSAIRYNVLTNSEISRNSTVKQSEIGNNNFTSCDILGNYLYFSSGISGNTLVGSGTVIKDNNLDWSSIGPLTTTGQTTIEKNTLRGESRIQNGTLVSGIIRNNNFSNSVLNLSNSGTLTTKFFTNINATAATINTNLSAATIIYQSYSKQIFQNAAFATRLGYYNASDVFTVVNVNA